MNISNQNAVVKNSLIVLFILLFNSNTFGQNTRINEKNNIGWYNFNSTFKLNKKFGIHTEYQWRRDNYISNWQQSLLRLGINYQLNPSVQFRVGYAWIETFAYGETPINSFGKDFTEHRSFEMVTLSNKVGIVDFSHRFMLEQRWIGRYTNLNLSKEDQYLFSNRMRYMFRAQFPLKGKTISKKTPYFAFYDEIFIGFGKNVNQNIFDQNRLGILFGYKINENLKFEGGYLNQTLQLGRAITNRIVIQNNNGFIFSTLLNFDLSKK
jgi:long-subunit fatty acid transport protein